MVEENEFHFTTLDRTLTFMIAGTFSGVMVDVFFSLLPSWARVPRSLYHFVLGIGLFGVAKLTTPLNLYGNAFLAISEEFNPDVVFFVLLPVLIFQAASRVDWNVFRKTFKSALWMALAGVLLFIAMNFYLFHLILHKVPGWSLSASILLASILSATDPVPVIAALQGVGAPPQLAGLIEGEALLNDASAFVAFEILLVIVLGELSSFEEAMYVFLKLAIGGPAWGLLIGILLFVAITYSRGNVLIETSAIVISIYVAYFVGELVLQISGILAATFLGFTVASVTKYRLSPEGERAREESLELLNYWAEMLIVILAGSIFAGVVFPDSVEQDLGLAARSEPWGVLLLVYVILQVSRIVIVLFSYPILSKSGYGLTIREAAFLAYAGLRGVDTLALALVVEESIKERLSSANPQRHRANPNLIHVADYITFILAGIVLLSSALNGYFAEFVYRRLNIYRPNPAKKNLFESALQSLEKSILNEGFVSVMIDEFYKNSLWQLVSLCVPDFSAVTLALGKVDVSKASLQIENAFVEYLQVNSGDVSKNPYWSPEISTGTTLLKLGSVSNKYEDTLSRKEELATTKRKSTLDSRIRKTTMLANTLHYRLDVLESVPVDKTEVLREIIFNSIRTHYQEQNEQNQLSNASKKVLDHFLSKSSEQNISLERALFLEFSQVQKFCLWEPKNFLFCLRIPLVESLWKSSILARYVKSIEVCLGYIKAHKEVLQVAGESFPDIDLPNIVRLVEDAVETLSTLKKRNRFVYSVAQALFTSRVMIHAKKTYLDELVKTGYFEKTEADALKKLLVDALSHLDSVERSSRIAGLILNQGSS